MGGQLARECRRVTPLASLCAHRELSSVDALQLLYPQANFNYRALNFNTY
jgi:hypothetical protein